MAINLNGPARQAAANLAVAFQGDDTHAVEEAFVEMQMAIHDSVVQEYKDAVAANDAVILAQRGFRQLTSAETEYYQTLINALSSADPRQEFANITKGTDNTVPEKMMPETIINDIFKNLPEAHPLLALIKPTSTQYITTWLRNKHTRQLAVWGEIETDIKGELKSAWEVVSVKQGKLTCFMVIHRDTLALGPTFLDGYMRTVMSEAMACGMEYGICGGKGIGGEPVGLDRDIREGVNVNQSTGYPRKGKIIITSFEPAEYGRIVAKLSKDERGHVKQNVNGLTLVCNLTDYLTKVMPATTVQNTDGEYKRNLFPIPTNVVTAEVIKDGEALLFLPNEYDLFVAGNRGIEYSDEYKFLEDLRVCKNVSYAFGMAHDNNSALLLDISGLEPGYVNVKVKGTVNTVAGAGLDDAVVSAATGADYWGFAPSDLQTNLKVAGGKITGTLKYIDSGSLASDWGPGYFMALKWAVDTDATSILVGLTPSEGSGLIEGISDLDRDGVFKVTDKNLQQFTIITRDANNSKVQFFDLSGLVFEDEG